jgi:hypothetical protein
MRARPYTVYLTVCCVPCKLLIPASRVVEAAKFAAGLGDAHTFARVWRAQTQISRERDCGLSRLCTEYGVTHARESRTTAAQLGAGARCVSAVRAPIAEFACVTNAIDHVEVGGSSRAVTRRHTKIGLTGYRTRDLLRTRRALYRRTGKA